MHKHYVVARNDNYGLEMYVNNTPWFTAQRRFRDWCIYTKLEFAKEVAEDCKRHGHDCKVFEIILKEIS